MKKILFFATAVTVMASCTSDNFLGEDKALAENNGNVIAFGSGVGSVTRADYVGADAAAKLQNKFIVSGFKGDGTAMSSVFDNYIVNWAANTAATTESNTSDWEYVGITAAAPSAITGTQTIKYWDFGVGQYDFAAFSAGNKTLITTGTPTAGQILVSAGGITKDATYAGPTYQLTGASSDLAGCYISDLVSAYKADGNFQQEVTLTFRSLGAKVRVALYETIPGYSVRDVKFYTDNTTNIAAGATETNATLIGSNFYTSGTYTVTFPTIGNANKTATDYNKAHVTVETGATTGTTQAFGALNYVAKHDRETTAGNVFLNLASNNPTYAGAAAPYYIDVLPNEAGQVLELRVDYTLESVDGSGETINIHGATAYVPAIYTTWKPGYAYTYLFKISDNTNGWTSLVETDPTGLYPITFDAVVTETTEYEQATITTVATPSITTYQKGHDITKNEYAAADGDIFVQVITDGTLNTDLGTKGQLYTLSAVKTEADVMDALNIQVSNVSGVITGRNGLVLTPATSVATITAIPGTDGNNITVAAGTAAKFTPATGTYAYVYSVSTGTPSDIYTAVPAGDITVGTTDVSSYYTTTDGVAYTAATGTAVAGTSYYAKYTNNNNVYGVKVIKVE